MKNSLNTLKNDFVEIKGSNKDIINTIDMFTNYTKFHIKRKVSNKILYLLLQKTRVSEIVISEKLSRTLPKKSLDAIMKCGVKVSLKSDTKRGRKNKYDPEKIRVLLSSGKISDIARLTKIPERTLYYYKKRLSFYNLV